LKKLFSLTLFLLSLLIIAGCSKDDNNDNPLAPGDGGNASTTISGTIDGWNLGAGKTISMTISYDLSTVYGSGTVGEDGSFSFVASAPPVAVPLFGYYDDPDCPGTINVSKQVNFMIGYLIVSDTSGVIGYVDKESTTETSSSSSFFFYVTGDVSVTGSETCSDNSSTTYNMNMAAGWNLIHEVSTYSNNVSTDELTTNEPAGAKYVLYATN